MDERAVAAKPELRQWTRFVEDARADARLAFGMSRILLAANVRMRYRRTALGYAWLVLPTAATVVVWTYLQSHRVVAVGHSRIPFAAHILAGAIVWQLLVEAMNVPLQEFDAKRQALRRTMLPLEAVVLAGVFEVFIAGLVRLLVIVPVLVALGVDMHGSMALVPVGLVVAVILGLAIGLVLSPLGMLVDDIGRGLTIVVGAWFLLTPVVYSQASGGIVRWNPATPVVAVTRGWLTGDSSSHGLVVVAVASILVIGAAWLLIRLARPHVVARLG